MAQRLRPTPPPPELWERVVLATLTIAPVAVLYGETREYHYLSTGALVCMALALFKAVREL